MGSPRTSGGTDAGERGRRRQEQTGVNMARSLQMSQDVERWLSVAGSFASGPPMCSSLCHAAHAHVFSHVSVLCVGVLARASLRSPRSGPLSASLSSEARSARFLPPSLPWPCGLVPPPLVPPHLCFPLRYPSPPAFSQGHTGPGCSSQARRARCQALWAVRLRRLGLDCCRQGHCGASVLTGVQLFGLASRLWL